jgi:hypothetical protein
LRSGKEEPPRDQHKSDHVEHPKTNAATTPAPAAENPSPRAGETEPAAKRETRGRQHAPASSTGQRPTDTANRSAASSASATAAPQSGTNNAPQSAEPRKEGAAPTGSAPSISWVNPPPAGGK